MFKTVQGVLGSHFEVDMELYGREKDEDRVQSHQPSHSNPHDYTRQRFLT